MEPISFDLLRDILYKLFPLSMTQSQKPTALTTSKAAKKKKKKITNKELGSLRENSAFTESQLEETQENLDRQ